MEQTPQLPLMPAMPSSPRWQTSLCDAPLRSSTLTALPYSMSQPRKSAESVRRTCLQVQQRLQPTLLPESTRKANWTTTASTLPGRQPSASSNPWCWTRNFLRPRPSPKTSGRLALPNWMPMQPISLPRTDAKWKFWAMTGWRP